LSLSPLTTEKTLYFRQILDWWFTCSIIGVLNGVGADLEKYMTLVSERQKLAASNIANADTPGYKTQDIDFQRELSSAMSGAAPDVVEVPGLRVRNDGNNVNIDRESRLLAENALRFNIASNLLRSQLKTIHTAIDGGTAAA